MGSSRRSGKLKFSASLKKKSKSKKRKGPLSKASSDFDQTFNKTMMSMLNKSIKGKKKGATLKKSKRKIIIDKEFSDSEAESLARKSRLSRTMSRSK